MTHNEVPHVYGVHPVLTALGNKKRRVRHVLAAPPLDKRLAKKIKQAKVPLIERPTSFLDALTKGANHQGVVALVGQFSYGDLDDLEGLIERLLVGGEAPLFLLLDGVQDPRNVGALVRSTLELGGHALVIPERRAAGITPAAAKTSAGAAEVLPVVRVVNMNRTLEALSRHGLNTVAAVEDGQPPEELDLKGPTALVLGSEGKGVRPSVRKHCAQKVTIPMLGVVGSLNVSVAGGVLLAEAARQRRR